MRLHVLGLPHTVVSDAYSPCAFTGKVLRFARMMRPLGYTVVEYSNGASESGADEHVRILEADELAAASRRTGDAEDYGADIHNEPLTAEFQRRLELAVARTARPGEIVCHVFGPNAGVMAAAPGCLHVESGIGYPCTEGACPYRVYESAAWMHWHLGRRGLEFGRNYEFVAPNYYDAAEWDVAPEPPAEPLVLYFGRLTSSKGLDSVVEVARRLPRVRFVLCGQGDAAWAERAPNLEYRPPVFGRARSALLGAATALLAPTAFVEPFCGAAVEAQLCGTPVVCTSYGAFCETVEDGATGFRCHTLADLVAAVERAPTLDRLYVAHRARALYTLAPVGRRYDEIFRDLLDLAGAGWYSERSHKPGLTPKSPS